MEKSFIIMFAALFCLSACEEPAADIEHAKQEQLTAAGIATVGMPAVVNFAEKRFMKQVLELRDNPKLATFTYIAGMDGKLHKICDSIGYGLPYATQYTSPAYGERFGTEGVAVLPQPDPNGLYSPASADGTWVLCINPKDLQPSPIYIEPRVVVSTFELS